MQAEMLLAIPHDEAAPIRERVLAASLQLPTGQSLMFCLVDWAGLKTDLKSHDGHIWFTKLETRIIESQTKNVRS